MGSLWAAFFVSGVAGLSYELTWVRYLSHVLGGATAAVSATVAVFFAGMAVGSWVGGRVFASRRRPALAYAALEATVGLVALLMPGAFAVLEGVLASRPATPSLAEPLLGSVAVLLLPTALLGATFPAMVAAVRRHTGPTRSAALPYGLNTLGAVLGCLLVSLWWLPSLGLHGTSTALAGLNLGVAALVLVASRLGWLPASTEAPEAAPHDATSEPSPSGHEAPDDAASEPSPSGHEATSEPSNGDGPDDEAPEPRGSDQTPSTERQSSEQPAVLSPRRALALASASGLLSIAVEVLWVRALSLTFPATVYVFAIVLAAYLVGIGAGSAAIARLHRHRAPRPAELMGAYAITALGGLLALDLVPTVGPWSLDLLAAGTLTSYGGYLGWIGGVSVLLMLPATVAMGAALPVLVGLASGHERAVPEVAGRVYGANTLGGVVGSLAGTFWLMPSLGLSRALALLALGYLALALAVPGVVGPSLRTARRGALALLALGAVVVALDLQPEVNALRHRPDAELLHYHDSPSGTVAVYEHDDGTRSLRIDNQYTLSDSAPATVAMQQRLGEVPMALHPAPRRALLVGFATGTTLAAMARTPGLRALECVEIHDEVFDLAPHFAEVNEQVWRNPIVELVEGDGRRHLARPGPAYDVVVEDLFVPRNPGVGSLYSVEHLQAVRGRLAEGGVLVVWLPLWQLGPDELRSIVRSFTTVFETSSAWTVPHSELRPILGLVAVAPGGRLAHDGLPGRAWPVLDAEGLRQLAGDAPPETLDRPVVELSAPRSIMRAKLEGQPLRTQTLALLPSLASPRPAPP